MVGVARDIATRAAVDGHARIDFIQIPVAPPLEPECLLGFYPRAFVLSNFLAPLDRPDGKKTEPGKRTADAEWSARHFGLKR